MPTLLQTAELETLNASPRGDVRSGCCEMAEAVDAIAAEQPLVLWLEDLHWVTRRR
jgi:hypothetical protein